MHKTPSEAEALLTEMLPPLRELAGVRAEGEPAVDVALAPPFTSLALAARLLAGSGIALCGQDCHWNEEGPYTGEVSAKMLAEVGCRYVILGHSERREFFAETNHRVNRKVQSALFWGLTPIICVGEKRDDRAAGRAATVVETQLKRCLADIKLERTHRILVAYEPVWSIGTGHVPMPAEVQEVHQMIKAELKVAFGPRHGEDLPVLYGGSVSPSNIGGLMALDVVDGALVGGASLDPASFLRIVEMVRDVGAARPR